MKLIPVMVYIHGGGFYSGAGNYGGSKYFMDTEEVVLVTINYRGVCCHVRKQLIGLYSMADSKVCDENASSSTETTITYSYSRFIAMNDITSMVH